MKKENVVVTTNTPSPALPGILSLEGRGKQVVPFAPLREKVGGARMRGHRHAFTLIELLVVVLIIGILAAVAVPQYQKAVEKSKSSEAMTLLKSIYNASKVHYLANGVWPTQFNQLDVSIPWTGKTQVISTAAIKDTSSNEDWSLQMFVDDGNAREKVVYISRLKGPYAKAGFMMCYKCYPPVIPADTLLCRDPDETGYCKKLFNGKRLYLPEHSSSPSPFLLP